MSSFSRVVVLLSLLCVADSRISRAAIAIGRPEWGFDGTVVERAFNILTVEVRNNGRENFEGIFSLNDGGSLGATQSAPYNQSVFLAPGTSRVLQFYPYVSAYFGGTWVLEWNENGRQAKESVMPSEQSYKLKVGPPTTVCLADFTAAASANYRIRAFNESNFPPTVSATDSLYAVVLDHQPKWDPARREAFLDWIKRGGIVHLIKGASGEFPEFTDDLVPLNTTTTPAVLGAGRIIRHNASRADVTDEFLRHQGYPGPSLSDDSSYDDPDEGIMTRLDSVTQPNISWWLIYLLTAIYIILIGPVFYICRRRDYRVLLASFVGVVVLFAWIFTVVGRRGYGEKQICHTLAVARALDAGRWDVHHWVHAFATSGNFYRFEFDGVSQLYCANGRGDSVRAQVFVGKNSHFDADIPLFSARPFMHRGVLTGPDLGAKLSGVGFPQTGSTRPTSLTINVGSGFPKNYLAMAVQYGAEFAKVARVPSGLELREPWTDSAATALGSVNSDFHDDDITAPSRRAEEAKRLLRFYGGVLSRFVSDDSRSRKRVSTNAPPEGMVRLFVYAEGPPSFRVKNSDFQTGVEYVLYVQDLDATPFLANTANPAPKAASTSAPGNPPTEAPSTPSAASPGPR